MSRLLLILLFGLAFAAPAHAATPCIADGRAIHDLTRTTCAQAKPVAEYVFAHWRGPHGWTCQLYRNSAWRGYCQTTAGRYFDWKPAF